MESASLFCAHTHTHIYTNTYSTSIRIEGKVSVRDGGSEDSGDHLYFLQAVWDRVSIDTLDAGSEAFSSEGLGHRNTLTLLIV